MGEILKKYKWMGPIIQAMDRDTKRIFMKNFRMRDKNFFPEGDYKADIKNLVNCMLCPNMCRFDLKKYFKFLFETVALFKQNRRKQ